MQDSEEERLVDPDPPSSTDAALAAIGMMHILFRE